MSAVANVMRWMTYEQASAYSTLSERALQRLVLEGRLRVARPVGGRTVIDRLELDKFMESSTGHADGGANCGDR